MCTLTATQVQADGKIVGQAIDNLAVALQPTDPAVAAQLTTAGAALVAATANWQEGTPTAAITDAENAVIVVLNLIPQTSPYADLIEIVFTALNLLIANTTTQPVQTTSAVANAHAMLTTAASLHTDSPWKRTGKSVIHTDFLHPLRKEFVNAFNAKATPLGVKTISL